jgi:hypothetical protein
MKRAPRSMRRSIYLKTGKRLGRAHIGGQLWESLWASHAPIPFEERDCFGENAVARAVILGRNEVMDQQPDIGIALTCVRRSLAKGAANFTYATFVDAVIPEFVSAGLYISTPRRYPESTSICPLQGKSPVGSAID